MVSHGTALQRRVANLERMIQVSRALRSAFDLRSLLEEIIRSIVELARCERGSIYLIDPDTSELRFVAVSGTDFDLVKDIAVPRHGSLAGTVVETGEPLVVHEARHDPRFFSRVDSVTGQTTRSVLGVPLEIGGRIIGVLQALNKEAGADFDSVDVETLQMFASQAAAAIENTRLIEEQRQRLTEVLLLQEVLLALSRFIRTDQLLEQLLVLLEEWLGYTDCAVLLFDGEGSTLRVETFRGFQGADLSGRMVPVSEGSASGKVALHREPLNVADIRTESTLAPLQHGTRSVLAVPMLCGEDVGLVGVICLESSEPGRFGARDVRILSTIGTQAAIGLRQSELYESSRRANRLKQEFIATMSHELRTPLTVLIGYCDVLAKQTLGPLNAAQTESLKVIRNRADLLLRLLNDVLDFSKIASGALTLYRTLVNLRGAVRSTVDRYSDYAQRKNQEITVDIPPDCRHVIADEQRVRQILGHLVENAIKFSSENRPIAIRASFHHDDYVRVDVVDQGIGIKPEDVDIVFEDFRQLDSSFTREYGGAGMGLAISRHLVELQGGMIWVESEFGKGSTFSFILPRPASSEHQTVELRIPSIPSA